MEMQEMNDRVGTRPRRRRAALWVEAILTGCVLAATGESMRAAVIPLYDPATGNLQVVIEEGEPVAIFGFHTNSRFGVDLAQWAVVGGSPVQNDGSVLAFMDFDGLPAGTYDLGPILPPYLTGVGDDVVGFSYSGFGTPASPGAFLQSDGSFEVEEWLLGPYPWESAFDEALEPIVAGNPAASAGPELPTEKEATSPTTPKPVDRFPDQNWVEPWMPADGTVEPPSPPDIEAKEIAVAIEGEPVAELGEVVPAVWQPHEWLMIDVPLGRHPGLIVPPDWTRFEEMLFEGTIEDGESNIVFDLELVMVDSTAIGEMPSLESDSVRGAMLRLASAAAGTPFANQNTISEGAAQPLLVPEPRGALLSLLAVVHALGAGRRSSGACKRSDSHLTRRAYAARSR